MSLVGGFGCLELVLYGIREGVATLSKYFIIMKLWTNENAVITELDQCEPGLAISLTGGAAV